MTSLIQAYHAEGDAHAGVGRALAVRDSWRLEFGVALRAERQRRGFSLRAAAKVFRCSAPFLSDVERGRRWSTRLAFDAFVLWAAPTTTDHHHHTKGDEG